MSEKTEITFMQTRLIRLASEEWHLPVEQIIHLFKEADVLGYIEKCYGIFHCEGDEAVLEDSTEFLQRKRIEISDWVKRWICSLSWKLLWSKKARSCQMCKEKRFWAGILFNYIQGAGRKFSENLNSQSNCNRNNWRGTAGDKKADDFCISQLLPNKLKDQYCFKNDKGGGEPPFYICEYPSVFVEKSIVIRL